MLMINPEDQSTWPGVDIHNAHDVEELEDRGWIAHPDNIDTDPRITEERWVFGLFFVPFVIVALIIIGRIVAWAFSL